MSPRLLIILSFVLSATAKAQSINPGTIKVTLFNEKDLPFENVTVALLKAKDSSLVKVALTDNKGVAEFEKIVPGSYLLKASAMNYALQYTPGERSSTSIAELPAFTMLFSTFTINLSFNF